MTTITQLTEIVNESLVPSNKKLDGSLVQISTNVDNKLSIAEDGLFVSVPNVDLTPYYTSSQTDSAISAAIAQAQLAGGGTEVDLSGYATLEHFDSLVNNLIFLATDKAEEAVAKVVNGAPATFDTLKEIATWIENDGVDASDLAASISGYATKAELAEYPKTADVLVSLGEQAEGLESQIALKADVSVLSEYATKDDLSEAFNEIPQGIATQLDTKLDKPVEIASETVTTPTVNSVPLYTIGNDGDYVLCTPDTWLKIGNFYVPAYTGSTVGITG